MALSATIKNLLNKLSPGSKKSGLGDLISGLDDKTQLATTTTAGIVLKGAAVNVAAGANPTKAEFDALVNSLKNAGVVG